MSTAVERKQLTVAQRTSEAARLAGDLLGLDDLKRVAAALAEAAVEGVRRNPSFAAHVRTLYEDMAARPPAAKKSRAPQSRKAEPDVELIPLKHIPGHEADSAAPPDPYFLVEFYGAVQLPLALSRYTVAELRDAVKVVQRRHTGTKPAGVGR